MIDVASREEFPEEREFKVNWEEFELKIRELRQCHKSKRIASPLLFRGQGNAAWGLQTTLECGHGVTNFSPFSSLPLQPLPRRHPSRALFPDLS